MTKKIENHTREQIARFLPKALRKALNSYHSFRKEGESNEVKKDPALFKKHHEACKAVIAHVQLLIKLAEWAHLPDKSSESKIEQSELAEMIDKAKSEIDEKTGAVV